MGTSKNVDWISIEGEYRAGIDALRTIADRNGVTEGAIRARAKGGDRGFDRVVEGHGRNAA